MNRKTGITLQVLILVLLVSPWWLFAQTPKPPSLKEQLEAQFSTDQALVIQKDGVLGVALASKPCAAKYQDGKLSPPDAACTAPLKNSSRPFPVGQKVNLGKIDIDLAKERISVQIVECASCNKGSELPPYKSQIDFQFGKGYLEKAGVSQIEDTISEVLAFDQPAQTASDTPAAPRQPGDASSNALTNSDVVKMAKVHLADGIILSKIKASACNFDTSVDALVKLKEAGVSDAVIQAMQDAQAAAPGPTPDGNNGLDVSGHWSATYTDSLGSGAVEVDLVQHPDGSVTGSTRQGAVVVSTLQGTLQGNNLTYTSTYTLPTCPGTTSGTVTFAGDTVSGHYQGRDCRGIVQNGVITESRAPVPDNGAGSAPAPGQTFSFRHRHRLMDSNWNIIDYYCSGTLSVSAGGAVAYDCAQTEDPSGRCEHVSFAPGALKEAKVGSGGNLHLASKKQGNFDLYGNADDIKQAQAAIAPLIQK
jgi:hypothetical protein